MFISINTEVLVEGGPGMIYVFERLRFGVNGCSFCLL